RGRPPARRLRGSPQPRRGRDATPPGCRPGGRSRRQRRRSGEERSPGEPSAMCPAGWLVRLGEEIGDEAALPIGRQRLPDDLAGCPESEVGDLAAEIGDRPLLLG